MITEQLFTYVRQQLAAGVPTAELTKNLVAQGWTEQDINQAIAASSKTPVVPAPPSPAPASFVTASSTQPATSHKTAITVAVILLLFVAGGIAAFAAPSVRSFIFSAFPITSTTTPQEETDIPATTQTSLQPAPRPLASMAEACAILFPDGVTEGTYSPPPTIAAGATAASAGGRVSAVQFILNDYVWKGFKNVDENIEIPITGIFDIATQQIIAKLEKEMSAFPAFFEDPKTKKPIPLDSPGELGAHGFRVFYYPCGFAQAKQQELDRPAARQFSVPGVVTLRVGETAATSDGKYKVTLKSFNVSDEGNYQLTEVGLIVVAGNKVNETLYAWGGQASVKPTISGDIEVRFTGVVGSGANTAVSFSISKISQ